MTEHYLMNKNTRLMLFTVAYDDILEEYECNEIERYVDENRFPPRFADIGDWLDKRNYVRYKEYLQEWLYVNQV